VWALRRAVAEAGKRKEEEKGRRAAEERAYNAELRTERARRLYFAISTGGAITTLAIALLTAYERVEPLRECGKWFADRADGLLALFSGARSLYLGLAGQFASLPAALGHAIAALTFLAGIAAAALLITYLWASLDIGERLMAARHRYDDGAFKGTLTASSATILFYLCLYLYEAIKEAVPLNIFSVWLLASLTAAAAINGRELAEAFKCC